MRKTSILQKRSSEHGGSFSVGTRRSRRPINIRKPVHLVMRSELATGVRNLRANRKIVLRTMMKFSKRFRVRVHDKAICGNHLHFLIKASSRRDLQNFFRVFAGQIAQEILKIHPLSDSEIRRRDQGGAEYAGGKKIGHPKNRRSFWTLLAYTRIVKWGWDFRTVKAYVVQNTLEAERIIPYRERKKSKNYAHFLKRKGLGYWAVGVLLVKAPDGAAVKFDSA